MSKLQHYTLQQNDGLWDRVSETIPEVAEVKNLDKADKFDWCVKQSFEEGAPYMGAIQKERTYGFYLSRYAKTYDRYFSKEMRLEDCLSDGLRKRFIPEQSGKSTSGNEFTSGKFYSVASSSRFAVASFTEKRENGELDYIESIKIKGKEETISISEFEHDTPITGIKEGRHCPQMDFFFKTENGTYFIEVKNHEILDIHKSIKLSPSYLGTDAFNELYLKKEIELDKNNFVNRKGEKTNNKYITVKGDTEKNRFLLASDFGCELKTFHFDFKQFLCHLMGIWSYAQKHKDENIFFYYLIYRNKCYEKEFDGKLYQEFEAEVATIFDVFGKRFPNIHFGLCYHDKYDTMRDMKPEIYI